MRKPLLIFSIIIIILAVAAAFIVLNKKTPNPAASNNEPSQINTETIASVPAAGQNAENNVENKVIIENFAFSPPISNINAGQKVVWTNNDSAPHQIKADSFNSGILNKGDAYEFVFVNPGAYNYYCGLHPSMKGQIIVK
ncbi:MAG: cupredoxin family copper-binding protein [Candidatus Paceibacterota bacterium]